MEIKIDGVIILPKGMTEDEFHEKHALFMSDNDCQFFGISNPVEEE